ncbi:MAG: anhydro-N-acetylmuramic acid kinase [Elusimicrobiota bacterium]
MLSLGLMSGTSADGVTAALTRFSGRRIEILKHETFAYPRNLRREILAAQGGLLSAREFSRLNAAVGLQFAVAAEKILAGGGPKPAVIGSHGQTLWHGPNDYPPNTLQIGEPSFIAERTHIPVVADFRPRDMAAGGQGAPLIAAFDEFAFGSGPLRAIQNIGGVSNASFIGRGRVYSSFDTGPGNCLMDLAARMASRGRLFMDKDGRLAGRGRPDLSALSRMMNHAYFRQKPPKSLDKDFFGRDFLTRRLGPVTPARLPNILATLSMLTARTIAEAYARFSPGEITETVVSGGGADNPVLMRHLKESLGSVPISRSDAYGIPAMAKEAAAFAWLAARAIARLPNNCPQATGARGPRILGKIIP